MIPHHLQTAVLRATYEIHPFTECWPWPGRVNAQGYGMVCGRGVRALAHRAAFEFFYRELAAGECVLHSCDNPPCCNPFHLRAGTRTENAAERDAKRRYQHGEQHYAAKLTAEQVREIRAFAARTGATKAVVAVKFGIKRWHAYKIIRRMIWKEEA